MRVAHLRRRVPIDREALRGVDAVLISHAHHDHLDLGSLQRIGRTTPLVVPRGLGSLLRRQGFRDVHELAVGENLEIGAARVEATFAAHDGSRPPYPARAPAVGYAVLGSRRIYFAGDTDLFPEMDGLVPDLDLALIPIWGWGPSLGRGAHLDPDGAAEAVALLRPKIAVPIHWGTYAPLYMGLRTVPKYLAEPQVAVQRRGGATRARRGGAGAVARARRSRSDATSPPAGGRRPFAATYSSSVRRPSDRSFASRSSSST